MLSAHVGVERLGRVSLVCKAGAMRTTDSTHKLALPPPTRTHTASGCLTLTTLHLLPYTHIHTACCSTHTACCSTHTVCHGDTPQVNDMSEVSLKDFSTRLAAAAAAPPGSGSSSIAGSKVELRSAVASASASAASLPQGAAASSSRHKPFAGSVTAVAASPHHVSGW